MSYEKELEIARLAVQRASLVTKRIKPLLQSADEVNKDDDTPVTIADLTAQALVIAALHHAFPNDTFLGEESAQILREDDNLANRVWNFVSNSREYCSEYVNGKLWTPGSKGEMLDIIDKGTGGGGAKGRHWVLDPIDGTMTYMTNEQYAVCLCLVEDGVKKVAVQGCPNLSLGSLPILESSIDLSERGGVIVSAVQNEGAWVQTLSDGPLEEAKRLPNRKAPASINELQNIESLKSTSMSHPSNKAVCEKLGVTYPGLDIWAQQMKYIALALGGWDLMVRVPKDAGHRGAAWDHASGQLICEEVGVVMTDLRGSKHDYSKGRRLYDNFGDVAAPIEWHGKVLEAVREVWKDGKASL